MYVRAKINSMQKRDSGPTRDLHSRAVASANWSWNCMTASNSSQRATCIQQGNSDSIAMWLGYLKLRMNAIRAHTPLLQERPLKSTPMNICVRPYPEIKLFVVWNHCVRFLPRLLLSPPLQNEVLLRLFQGRLSPLSNDTKRARVRHAPNACTQCTHYCLVGVQWK